MKGMEERGKKSGKRKKKKGSEKKLYENQENDILREVAREKGR
jgi:hypothetical protein